MLQALKPARCVGFEASGYRHYLKIIAIFQLFNALLLFCGLSNDSTLSSLSSQSLDSAQIKKR